ncbi:MAG: F0F1 ATP synthase subunit B [Halanaerobium sp.]|nr:F0F1 ATP synthase subunit B [Halanaerobium sp.]
MQLVNSTLFWEVVNFLVLMGALTYFLYKPIVNLLEERKKRVKSDLNSAQEKREEAQRMLERYEAKLDQAREEGDKIVENAEERARLREKEIVEEAQKEARRIVERAKEETQLMKRKALQEVKEQTAYLTIMAASKLLREQLDQEKHARLVEDYINSLDQDSLGELQ